jgi:hypothetical protein
MRLSVAATASAALAISGGAMVSDLGTLVHPPSKPAGLDAHETHGASSLLGQFRTSTSSWLWLRTDLYLHNGVEMRRLTDHEIQRGHEGVGGHDDGHEQLHDDSQIVTVIPGAERDFRGIFGDLERITKAYKDMKGHAHNDPETALPLFRLMTAIDPQFIPGWITGGMVIARKRTEEGTTKALEYLQSGLDQNPESLAIRSEMARLLITRRSDFNRAIILLEDAVALGWEHRDHLSEDEQEAVVDCFRWLSMALREVGKQERSQEVAAWGLEMVPDDGVLKRLANPAPSLWSAEDQKEWYQAIVGTAGNPAPSHDHEHDHSHDHDDHGHGHDH